MTFSYHMQLERANRLAKLEEVLGFSKIILEITNESNRVCLTSSGIIVIMDLHKDYVVTAFMANVKRCAALYRAAGKSQIPPKVYKRVVKNNKRHPELISICN